MPINICEQTVSFFSCICLGFVLGIIYDLLSAIRKGFSLGKICVFFLDSLFWQISAIIFFAVLYFTCGGAFRWYVMLGLLLGLAFYVFTLSAFIRPFAEKFVKSVFHFLKLFLRLIITPFSKLLQFFLWILRPLRKFVKCALKKPMKFVKNTIAKIRRFSVKYIWIYRKKSVSVDK